MALNYKLTTEARQGLDEALTWYRQRREGLEAQSMLYTRPGIYSILLSTFSRLSKRKTCCRFRLPACPQASTTE